MLGGVLLEDEARRQDQQQEGDIPFCQDLLYALNRSEETLPSRFDPLLVE